MTFPFVVPRTPVIRSPGFRIAEIETGRWLLRRLVGFASAPPSNSVLPMTQTVSAITAKACAPHRRGLRLPPAPILISSPSRFPLPPTLARPADRAPTLPNASHSTAEARTPHHPRFDPSPLPLRANTSSARSGLRPPPRSGFYVAPKLPVCRPCSGDASTPALGVLEAE